MVRTARCDDLPKLRELERAAGSPFRELGMYAVADDEPPSIADLEAFHDDGRAWVVADDADEPVAYLLVDVVDGNGHVEQVSVHPAHARQGLGKMLLDTAAAWAEQRRLAAITLTTYSDVPWNRPYYERLGFRALDESEMTPGLRRLRVQEAARGLAQWPRVTMQRPVRKQSPSRSRDPSAGSAEICIDGVSGRSVRCPASSSPSPAATASRFRSSYATAAPTASSTRQRLPLICVAARPSATSRGRST